MVQVTIHDQEDRLIARVKMHHAPRVGEVIWLLPTKEHEDSALKITEVCHWVSDQHDCHDVCIYVESLKKEE